jgi:HD superfamily phosphodiesterase
MNSKVQSLRDYVAEDLKNLCAAHDFYHIDRVERLASFLAGKE